MLKKLKALLLSEMGTQVVVGGTLGVILVVAAYLLAGPVWGTVITLLVAWEFWTLRNKWPGDTISEIIRKWARAGMFVPLGFGLMTGWAVESGSLGSRWLILVAGILLGHWFWPMGEDRGD
jgi:hypothetical protein